MHYLIKREKCEMCLDTTVDHRPFTQASAPCTHCTNGYIETRVDADLWLREKLREFADEK